MYRSCRRLLLLVLVLCVAPWSATAQIPLALTWDHSAPSTVTGYRLSVDGAAARDYGLTPSGTGGLCGCSVPLSLAAGRHTFVVTAYNSAGATVSQQLVYTAQAPATPTLPGSPTSPAPAAGATGVMTSTALTWSATAATSYDVRLGVSNPPVTVVAAALTSASYQPALTAGTRYFWQIVARNSAGATAGPIWSFTAATAPTTGLPAPWSSQDIGTVGVSGSAAYANGIFTVTGGGLDIWGTADAFHYLSQPLAGDGEIIARVTDLQNTHTNAKAGVMMRGALTASAQHVMINAAVDGSVEFMTRSAAGRAAAFIAGGTQRRPTWLKLTRVGSTVTGSISSNGQAWSVVGSTTVSGLAYMGLAVTSADTSERNNSTFDSVAVAGTPVTPPPGTPTPSLPGAPTTPGPATLSTGVLTSTRLTWSATDASTYDLMLGISNPPGTVVGSSLAAASYQPALAAGTRYFWQVLARNSAGSTAGPVWSFTTATAPPATGIPTPWTSQDIGLVGVSGSASWGSGIFTVIGGGLDIWGTADAFQYVSQPLAGDGEIVARVTALQNTHGNAKAGVMMRGSFTAAAPHVMLNAAVDGSIELISRSATGRTATFIAGGSQPRPAWLKLTRAGSLVTGSVSRDGQYWSIVGSTTVSGLAHAGLVVTSADLSQRNVSTFDSVLVSTGSGPAAPVGDVVIYASDVTQAGLHGSWQTASDSTSPNRIKLTTTNVGVTTANNPLASPSHYVDISFNAAAGIPYTIWLRLRALNNSAANDSVWLQFSDARAGGSPIYPIGGTSGLLVTLATDGTGSSLNQWGWQNDAYWLSQTTTVTFANSGQHTLRVQVREDGVQVDQIVLSPSIYLTEAPGQVSGDQTIVPK